MREQFLAQAKANGLHGENLLRELLQWEILAALHSVEAFKEVAFVGGTCLRLVHGLHRFSEDLDFSACRSGQPAFLEQVPRKLEHHLAGCDFSDVEVQMKPSEGAVTTVWVKFPSLLKELGTAAMASQKLGIKLEFDCNPPAGAQRVRHIVSSPRLLALTVYDLPSLMAGKLHAILARPYSKGRDWYDLVWYLGRKLEPNVAFLKAALEQRPSPWCEVADEWKQGVGKAAKAAKWDQIRRDVSPFLELGSEVELFEERLVIDLLKS